MSTTTTTSQEAVRRFLKAAHFYAQWRALPWLDEDGAVYAGQMLDDLVTGSAQLATCGDGKPALAIFGTRATEAMRELLETRGIALRTQSTPVSFEEGLLRLSPRGLAQRDEQ